MKWYDTPVNKVRYFQLKEPYSHIFVGTDCRDGMSLEFCSQFQAIINVSGSMGTLMDTPPHNPKMHWFPIIELGYWGYPPFFASKRALDYHFEKGDKIYVHCHAGANRSPMIVLAWLQSRGHSLKESADILGKDVYATKWEDQIKNKHIPQDIIYFLSKLNHNQYGIDVAHQWKELKGFDATTEKVRKKRKKMQTI